MIANTPRYWKALDLIGEACTLHAGPGWRAQWRARSRKTPRPIPDDQALMRHFAVAIAYSQGTRSSIISDLVKESFFGEAFADFDPVRLSSADPAVVLDRYWGQLGHIRFKGKVAHVIGCAKVLTAITDERGSFATYLKSFAVPRRLQSQEDVVRFWECFNRLQRDLNARYMPFFRSTTSLLQLLLDLDYDSVKPDIIVMRLAKRIGMVERETGDKHLRAAARKTQEYAVARGLRAQAVDLQLLAFGGQTGARRLPH